ncbi:MAG: amidohydrolase family protein, partial [Clostridiaceae bacterium]|nr:amidohydrolase family protein [Clostridiaceae bacterium]
MAERILIHNAACILPDGIGPAGQVLIETEGARIASIRPAGKHDAVPHELDARGGFVVPGFIDIHCHGGDGHDFMDGTVTAFRAIAQVHAQHGTTLIAPTTVACSLDELKDLFGLLRQVQAQGTGGAELAGIHLEGPYLAPVMKGAQPESAIRLPDRREVQAILEIGRGLISRWSAAPELPGSRDFARMVTAAGIPLSIAHSEATCEQVLEAYQWGFHSV